MCGRGKCVFGFALEWRLKPGGHSAISRQRIRAQGIKPRRDHRHGRRPTAIVANRQVDQWGIIKINAHKGPRRRPARQLHVTGWSVAYGINRQQRRDVCCGGLINRWQQIDAIFGHQKCRWRTGCEAGVGCNFGFCCEVRGFCQVRGGGGIWRGLRTDRRGSDDCRRGTYNRRHRGGQSNFSVGRNFRQVGKNTGHRQHARHRAWIQHKQHNKIALRVGRCGRQRFAVKPQDHLRPWRSFAGNKGLAIGFHPDQIEGRTAAIGRLRVFGGRWLFAVKRCSYGLLWCQCRGVGSGVSREGRGSSLACIRRWQGFCRKVCGCEVCGCRVWRRGHLINRPQPVSCRNQDDRATCQKCRPGTGAHVFEARHLHSP